MPDECLAVIPARGGSKGIPNKNLVPLGGEPLIAWTIRAARAAGHVRRIIVSTEDSEIAEVSANLGAEVPFMRPSALAQDDTPGTAAPLHALRWLAKNESYHPNQMILLQPTSPLRQASDIDEAINLLRSRKGDAVLSLTAVHHHPEWMFQMDSSARISHYSTADLNRNRQELPDRYAENGAIFLVQCERFLAEESWYSERTYGYLMPEERSIDINTESDLRLAEFLLQQE